MDTPLISLGMPVYNGEQFLADAIDSIIAQSWTNWELLISDNASTDKTPELCEHYARLDARIQYHRNHTNLGAHPNYNQTFQFSNGKYFKWVPHDDTLHKDYLSKCAATLESDPDSVLCQSHLKFITSEGKSIGVYDSNLKGSESPVVATRFGSVILRTHAAYEVMGLFRRTALEDSILLQSFHGSDKALLAELSLRGRFSKVHEPLLFVRDHPGRYSRAQTKPRDRAAWHDVKNKSLITLPTWRLYYEYIRMVPRNLKGIDDRMKCLSRLFAWWFMNWNAARLIVDVVAVVAPGTLETADRLKNTLISPSPGASQVKASKKKAPLTDV